MRRLRNGIALARDIDRQAKAGLATVEQGTEREIRSLDEASVLLDEWAAAYEELRKDHQRLLHRYMLAKQELAHARYAIECDLLLEELKGNGDLAVIDVTRSPLSECPF